MGGCTSRSVDPDGPLGGVFREELCPVPNIAGVRPIDPAIITGETVLVSYLRLYGVIDPAVVCFPLLIQDRNRRKRAATDVTTATVGPTITPTCLLWCLGSGGALDPAWLVQENRDHKASLRTWLQ